MLPFAAGAAAAAIETGAALIGVAADVSTSPTMAAIGAAAGDYVLVFNLNGGTPSLSGGVALIGVGTGFYGKLLDGSDLTRTASATGNSITVLIYRGVTSAAQVAGEVVTPGTVGTRSFAGFTKDMHHAGIVGGIYAQSPGASAAISQPATFTNRAFFNASIGGGNGRNLVADRLQPVNPLYVSGTAFEWSASSNGIIAIVELRSA